jgi:drug/metabolite transporter (DMT)-like permease
MQRSNDPRCAEPLLTSRDHDDYCPDCDCDCDVTRGRPLYRTFVRQADLLCQAASTTLAFSTSPAQPMTTRTNTGGSTGLLRSRSPPQATAAAARAEARRRYAYAAFFLTTSLISFTVQTMLASHIQHNLGWDKAYCMLFLTHSSWVFLWPSQFLILRLLDGRRRRRRSAGAGHMSWRRFWDEHWRTLRGIALAVETRDIRAAKAANTPNDLLDYGHSPWPYLAKTTAVVTSALTIAGLTWYLAVSMTTPSDLTAIYNCSAFFAYAFSVPLLKERLRLDKMLAVAVAIAGVLIVAYGDGSGSSSEASATVNTDAGSGQPGLIDPATRFLGNIIIGIGSVLYGLYEVLYKRYACPPEGLDATRGVIFANTFGSLMGAFTLLVLWIPLPLLHVLGWETFEVPTGRTAWLLFISVIMNMVFSGSFLTLISLTSPVLSSVAALLTIFIVAIADWWVTGVPLSPAAVLGCSLIIAAFAMLSWSTWREMNEEANRKQDDLSSDDDD